MTMKVKGIVCPQTGLKDFVITYKGQEHHCSRSGQKFTWNGHRGTLKALKGAIMEHHESDAPLGEVAATDPSEGSTWHTDAAALLALQVSGMALDYEWINDALQKHGYVKPNGDIDLASAIRVVKRIYGEVL